MGQWRNREQSWPHQDLLSRNVLGLAMRMFHPVSSNLQSTDGLTVSARIEIVADLQTSSHPQMSASHLHWLQGPRQTQASTFLCMQLLQFNFLVHTVQYYTHWENVDGKTLGHRFPFVELSLRHNIQSILLWANEETENSRGCSIAHYTPKYTLGNFFILYRIWHVNYRVVQNIYGTASCLQVIKKIQTRIVV